jgi:REP element-mobilizing transposase RayT
MSLYQDKYRVEPARLRSWDYSSRGWYFVTICTQNRAQIFGEVVNADVIADSELKTLHSHYENVELGAHVVMPNHIHILITIGGDHRFTPNPLAMTFEDLRPAFIPPKAGSLSAIVRSYKAGVTRQAHHLGFTQGIWQPRFHDHLLRGDATIAAVCEYIRNNPANWAKDKENPRHRACLP